MNWLISLSKFFTCNLSEDETDEVCNKTEEQNSDLRFDCRKFTVPASSAKKVSKTNKANQKYLLQIIYIQG